MYPLSKIPGSSQADAYNTLTDIINTTFNQTNVPGKGRGIYRSFYTKEDVAEVMNKSNVLFLGMLNLVLDKINIDVVPVLLTNATTFENMQQNLRYAAMEQIPALGTSRTRTFNYTKNVSTAKRYGTGVFMEGDFKDTEQGRDKIMENLIYSVGMANETLKWVAYSTLQAGDLKDPYMGTFSYINDENDYRFQMLDAKENFATAHKYNNGINKVVLDNVALMERLNQVRPNICLAPRGKINAIMSVGNKQYTQHSIAGEQGVARAMGKGEEHMVNDIILREAPLPTSDRTYRENSPSVMNRDVFTGDFWVLRQKRGQNLETFLDMEVYDVNMNQNVFLTYEGGASHGGRLKYVKSGDPLPYHAHNGLVPKAPMDGWYFDEITLRYNLRTRLADSESPDPFLAPGSLTFGATYNDGVVYNATAGGWCVDSMFLFPPKFPNGDPFDHSLLAWQKTDLLEQTFIRPMNGYRMQDAILLKGSTNPEELGYTAHSDYNIDVGKDVGNTSFRFEWRGWVGCHINNWKRVFIVRNQFYDGIISGGNCKLITKVIADRYSRNNFNLESINDPSIYCMTMPGKAARNAPKFLDDDLYFHLAGHSPFRGGDGSSYKEEYPGSAFYNSYYGWNKIGLDNAAPISPVVWRGYYRYYTSQGMMNEVPGSSYHGPVEGPGCHEVRRLGMKVNPNPIFN